MLKLVLERKKSSTLGYCFGLYNSIFLILKQLQLLNRLVYLHCFTTIKNLHISELFICNPEYADLAKWGHPSLDTLDMYICIFSTGTMTQINTELKHSEAIHQEFLAE